MPETVAVDRELTGGEAIRALYERRSLIVMLRDFGEVIAQRASDCDDRKEEWGLTPDDIGALYDLAYSMRDLADALDTPVTAEEASRA